MYIGPAIAQLVEHMTVVAAGRQGGGELKKTVGKNTIKNPGDPKILSRSPKTL